MHAVKLSYVIKQKQQKKKNNKQIEKASIVRCHWLSWTKLLDFSQFQWNFQAKSTKVVSKGIPPNLKFIVYYDWHDGRYVTACAGSINCVLFFFNTDYNTLCLTLSDMYNGTDRDHLKRNTFHEAFQRDCEQITSNDDRNIKSLRSIAFKRQRTKEATKTTTTTYEKLLWNVTIFK